MPKLPSADTMGRATPRAVGSVPQYRTAPVVDAGKGLTEFAEGQAQRVDRLDYATAQSAFLKSKLALDQEFEQDKDWSTAEQRYTERLAAERDKAAGAIVNRQNRTLFAADSDLHLQRGIGSVRQLARAKEVDHYTAATETELQSNMDAALRAPDETTRTGLIDASNMLVNSMVARGYWDETRGSRVRQGFVKQYQGQKDALVAQEIATSLESARNFVVTNPAAFDDKRAEVDQKIDRSGISTEAREKLRTAAHKGLALSAVQGQLQANPGMALASLKGGTWDVYLDADNKAALVNTANAEIKRRRSEGIAEARTSIALGLQDELTTIRATGRSAGLVTPEIVRAAYPDDSRKADAVIRQLEAEKRFYTVRQSVSLSSPEEDKATLAGLTASVSGPGATSAAEHARELQAAVSAKHRALKSDPAAYVTQASPYVGDLLKASAADPSKLKHYAEATLQMQEQLGVPEQDRRILSEPQMEGIVARFGSQDKGGEDAATTMQGLAEQWGPLWPRVYGEMVESEKLPAMAAVVGSMPAGRAATSLAEAVKVGIESLRKIVGEDAKAVRDGIPNAMADIRFSVLALGTPDAHTMYQNYANAAEALALKYVAEGQSTSSAIQRAANEVAVGRYEFRGTWRAPKEKNVDRIAAGAAVAHETLPNMIDVPRSGLPPDVALDAYKKQVGSRGFWVTAPDDTGLVLYDETGSAVTVQGRPYKLTWGELEALAGAKPDAAKAPLEQTKNRMIRDEEAARRQREAVGDGG